MAPGRNWPSSRNSESLADLLSDHAPAIKKRDGDAPVPRIGRILHDHRLAIRDTLDALETLLRDTAQRQPAPMLTAAVTARGEAAAPIPYAACIALRSRGPQGCAA